MMNEHEEKIKTIAYSVVLVIDKYICDYKKYSQAELLEVCEYIEKNEDEIINNLYLEQNDNKQFLKFCRRVLAQLETIKRDERN